MGKTNEAVYRSPKWLRNLLDYEVSTGKDIKGEPSLKMKKKLAEEKAEKERKYWEDRKEQFRKEQEENKRKREEQNKKDEAEFDELFPALMYFLAGNYSKSNVVRDLYVEDNKIVVEFGATHPRYKRVEAKVGYYYKDNSKTIFSVEIECENGKLFSYRVSGLVYNNYVTTINAIVKWWRISGKSFNKQSGKQAPPKQEPPKAKVNEKDPDKNRTRRLNLLKDTLAGYERQLARTPEGPDKDQLRNEIANIKGRIKVMEKPRANEKLNHLMSYQIFEKQFAPIKDDYVMITYALTGEPVPARIVKVYPNNTYLVSFDVEGSTARGAQEATIRNSDIISPYKPIRSPVGSGFISANTNFQVRNTQNVNQVSNDMYL